MSLSFKNRIALYYMLATATMVAFVFLIIFSIVKTSVYSHLDADLSYEARKHTKEVKMENDSMYFINKQEWKEREHREAEVNPVFIQVVNTAGKIMDKSPNLKEGVLQFDRKQQFSVHFNATLNGKAIRQTQVPLLDQGHQTGFLLAAMSFEDSQMVLLSLKKILLVLYPIVLITLFVVTRFLAGRSIIPVQTITATADRISRHSLNERIPLPKNQDELFTLTSSINQLLERIEQAMNREKQFTSDASHELRTPLAVLKGTLEVLVRKPRTPQEYTEKIHLSIREIDRMTQIVDQLLLLARFDSQSKPLDCREINLLASIDDVLQRHKNSIKAKNISVDVDARGDANIISDPYLLDLILENLISNAIKYSASPSTIHIQIDRIGSRTQCTIQDQGIGIKAEDQPKIFDSFFRSEALEHRSIKGTGLGLSIVKKACALLAIELSVKSEAHNGTAFSLLFPKNN